MPQIELNEKINESFYKASPAAWQLACDMAAGKAPYEAVSLSMNLSSFKLPDVGNVAVIVDITLGDAIGVPPNEFELKLHARNANSFFPQFEGHVRALDDGGSAAWVFLVGSYVAPFGPLGRALDATLMHGVAQESLHTFLRWFATETQARIARGDYKTAAELMRQNDG